MDQYVIRRCAEADIPAAGAFYDRVVWDLTTHINYPKWMYREYPSEASARAMTEAGAQYVCMDRGEVIGAFVLNEDPQGSYEKGHWRQTLEPGTFLVCHALAVAPERKGQGIGRLMVEYCLALAKEQGYRALRLDIVPGNTPAQRLYESCGFREVETLDLDRGYEQIPLFTLYEYNF